MDFYRASNSRVRSALEGVLFRGWVFQAPYETCTTVQHLLDEKSCRLLTHHSKHCGND
jgi:hypothetical protein